MRQRWRGGDPSEHATGARRYAPSSRLPVARIYVLMAAVCARTRVPIAILSGVVHITPAKVLLSFSRVRSRPSRREEEYWSLLLTTGLASHDFSYEFRGPPLHLGPRLGLGRWRRGPG